MADSELGRAFLYVAHNAEILSVSEVATLLRCSKAHVCKAIQGRVRGVTRLPALSMGRRKLIRRESLDAWLAHNDRNSAGPAMIASTADRPDGDVGI